MESESRPFLKTHFLLIAILLAGIFFRFYGLQDRGLVLYDACLYANTAKTPVYAWNYITANSQPVDTGTLVSFLNDSGCKFSGIRPGHIFLIFLSFLIFGVKDWAVILPSALAGAASVFMVYAIGSRFFSRKAGLIAALFLAISGFQVAYSRTGYPQSQTLLLVAFLIYFYFRYRDEARMGFLYLSGLALGLGFFFHPSFFLVALPVAIHFLFVLIRSREPGIKKLLILALVTAAPLLVEEIFIAVVNSVFPERNVISIVSFFLVQKGSVFKGHGFIPGLKFFLEMIAKTDGIVWLAIYLAGVAAGLVFFFRERQALLAVLMVQILFPILFWAWRYPTLKAIDVCYPAIALVSGYAVWQVMRRFKKPGLALGFFVLFIAVTANYGFLLKQLDFRIHYPEAVIKTREVVKKEGGRFFAMDQQNLYQHLEFYMPLVNDGPRGNEFRAPGKQIYYMIDYRQLMIYAEEIRNITEQGRLVFRDRLFKEFLPITHYHRLNKKGYEYLMKNFQEEWLYVTLYEMQEAAVSG
jgi:4-amino-4-deoxy-L-arabinose transferase-like glycosyltransferase